MSEIEVRIEELPPMRVVSFHGYGAEPETEAWRRLAAWAEPRGLQEQVTLGFNNPDPSPGTPNYGYELWLFVEQETVVDDDVTVKAFSGGLYAVTRFQGLEQIGVVWKALVRWREQSPYVQGPHQWLEKLLTGPDVPPEEFVFDLYLPIVERVADSTP